MKLRATILLVLAVLAVAGLAYCEEPYPYPAGETQVVFGFSGWQLGSYEGGLGFRLFHPGRLASLVMFDLGINSRWSESRYDTTGLDIDGTGVGFGMSYTLEKYLSTFHSVAPYVGVGAMYSYYWSEDERTDAYDLEDRETSKSTSHRATLQGVLGAEWAFTSGISLGARYYMRLGRTWERLERNYYGERYSRDTDAWSFVSGAGYLTASLRF
ncbi:MAG: hypothetical protein PVJ42_03360 [bacterium]|jgi:hypothetical protein